jgi:DUF438 domain-containing protein
MNITPETKLGALLKEHPQLIEFLPTLSPAYESIKNPVLRRTMLGRATLGMVAERGGLEVAALIEAIEAEISRKETSDDRMEILKGIIRDLHAGVDMEVLRTRFAELVKDVSPTEISRLEQSLIDEGLPEEEVKRLCDVHVEVFRHSLDQQESPRPPSGHPVHNLMAENRATENILGEIEAVLTECAHDAEKIRAHSKELGRLLEKLSEIEKHYVKKENQLFPRLEERGVSGPSRVMWAIHDDIRKVLKLSREQVAEGNPRAALTLEELIVTIRDMIYKEEQILYPMSMETLTYGDWLKVKEGEEEIGFAWISPLFDWPPEGDVAETPEALVEIAPSGKLEMEYGSLSLEQVNLVLSHLPVEITFVGEDDRVAFFTLGRDKIFARSPGIIGREVQKCHPPASVHIVKKILDEFKSGSKDKADFWIQRAGKFILIRYYAVRDAQGNYMGTMEVTQDVTEIRGLEGDQRLLDWEN